jgi:hypothetical protein
MSSRWAVRSKRTAQAQDHDRPHLGLTYTWQPGAREAGTRAGGGGKPIGEALKSRRCDREHPASKLRRACSGLSRESVRGEKEVLNGDKAGRYERMVISFLHDDA